MGGAGGGSYGRRGAPSGRARTARREEHPTMDAPTTTAGGLRSAPRPHLSAGTWMALAAVVLLIVNVVRAVTDPVGFVAFFGLAEAAAGNGDLAVVYAIRTLFVAVLAAVLIVRRDLPGLTTFALAAVLIPVGDALLVAARSGPPLVIARHVAIAVFLLATWWVLRRDARRGARDQ